MLASIKESLRLFLPRRVKALRIRGGPLAGRLICTSWHDYPGAIRGDTETPLLEWFARHVQAGETWLDVGAHYGYTAIALAERVGRSGRVFAFEPVATTAQCIERTRDFNRLSQLIVVPLGLTAAADADTVQTCRLPLHRGMADSTFSGHASSASIRVAAFDPLWASLSGGNPHVHGVKIDVQGMEDRVLAGMAGMLRVFQPKLVVEFHSGVSASAILDFLVSCGYDRCPEPLEPGASEIRPDKSYAFAAICQDGRPLWTTL